MDIIKAIIWLEPIKSGSRSHPVTVGWCPHLCLANGHNDSNGQPLYMGVRLAQLSAGESEWLKPGESGEVTFQLIFFDPQRAMGIEHYQPLQAGREFEIREGSHVIGYGCVQSRNLASE